MTQKVFTKRDRVKHLDGAEGTVTNVTPSGSVWVHWDDGSSTPWDTDEYDAIEVIPVPTGMQSHLKGHKVVKPK